MKTKYLSVCSGIEAASVAWHPLGWKPLAFSEIEAFPRKVLAHRFPETPLYGDFTKLRDEPWIGEADVLVGGTPCQAFSVAGLRQSLADERGNLSLEFVRLANAIDDVRPAGDGCIILWENVPGVLSVKDNAFGCFLAALVGNDTPLVPTGGKWTNAGLVVGPQRSAAWRILDAQYFGVAQRRRRVFVVASSRDGFDPAEVLFEREGMRRDIAPRREAGERTAPTITSGAPFSRTGNDRTEADAVVGTLDARHAGGFQSVQSAGAGHLLPIAYRVHGEHSIAMTSNGIARVADQTDITRALDTNGGYATNQGGNVVMQPIAFALQHAQIGRKDEAGPQGKGWQEEVAFTQDSRPTADAVAIAFHPTQDPISSTDGTTHALGCGSSQGQASIVVSVMRESGQGYWMEDSIANTLRAEGENRPSRPSHVVAFHPTQDPISSSDGSTHALGCGSSQGQASIAVAVNIYGGNKRPDRPEGGFYVRMDEETSKTLDAASGLNPTAAQGGTAVISSMAVRRLTPRECERLQGFPDDWTLIDPKTADGPRYKALGNSMAVPVMRWIGKRIDNRI